MIRWVLILFVSLNGWGCSGDEYCPMYELPLRGKYMTESRCETSALGWTFASKSTPKEHVGPMHLRFDYEEGVVIIEYEVKDDEGRIVPVKETWRQID